MAREFTGRHLLVILVIGFGIVVAVNFYMASVAARIFNGIVVENSYVASQKYNSWLVEAERQRALGWTVVISRDGNGRLHAATQGVPAGAITSAILRRPLGEVDERSLDLAPAATGGFVSDAPVPSGRWIVRLTVRSQGEQMQLEAEIQ